MKGLRNSDIKTFRGDKIYGVVVLVQVLVQVLVGEATLWYKLLGCSDMTVQGIRGPRGR
jgi:hypothetical protein